MSDTRLRKVENKEKLHEITDDYQIQGYSVKERSDKHVRLIKRNKGTAGMHVLLALLTFWFSLGIGNLIYFLYSYYGNSEEIMVKIS